MSEYQRFLADNGEAKRYQYDLTPDSYVFDVGGYKGEFAENIFMQYGCNVYVFEPVFGEKLIEKFRDNDKVLVFEFGLSDRNCTKHIAVSEDSTSLHKIYKSTLPITLWSMKDLMGWHKTHIVDLIKINIEGEEYALLECIIKHNMTTRFKNIQVQFHDFAPNAAERMRAIQEKLSETHELTYQYGFIWENWRLK